MKKLIILFLCMCAMLCLTGCGNNFPLISINAKPFTSTIQINLGNKKLAFNTFERIDDEAGTKLILYFDKIEED